MIDESASRRCCEEHNRWSRARRSSEIGPLAEATVQEIRATALDCEGFARATALETRTSSTAMPASVAALVPAETLRRLCDDWLEMHARLAHLPRGFTWPDGVAVDGLPVIGVCTETWYHLYESAFVAGVRAFHEKHGAYTAATPSVPPPDVVDLRQRLIEEEWSELWAAMLTADAAKAGNGPDLLPSLAAVADALADLLYVVIGAGLAYGLPLDAVFAEVQRSNLTKQVVAQTGRGDKVGKGPSFSPPDLVPILIAACGLSGREPGSAAEQEVPTSERIAQDAQAMLPPIDPCARE